MHDLLLVAAGERADHDFGTRRAHVESSDRLPRERALAGARHEKAGRDALEDGQDQVAPDGVANQEPAAAPVVGDEAEPLAARAADRGQARGRAVDLERRRTIFRFPPRHRARSGARCALRP